MTAQDAAIIIQRMLRGATSGEPDGGVAFSGVEDRVRIPAIIPALRATFAAPILPLPMARMSGRRALSR